MKWRIQNPNLTAKRKSNQRPKLQILLLGEKAELLPISVLSRKKDSVNRVNKEQTRLCVNAFKTLMHHHSYHHHQKLPFGESAPKKSPASELQRIVDALTTSIDVLNPYSNKILNLINSMASQHRQTKIQDGSLETRTLTSTAPIREPASNTYDPACNLNMSTTIQQLRNHTKSNRFNHPNRFLSTEKVPPSPSKVQPAVTTN